jgi:hypothetical protein
MRVYVASPYSAPSLEQRIENVSRACDAGSQLMRLGYQPFIPVLSHYLDEFAAENGGRFDWDRWMEWALTWVAQCEAVLVLGISHGVVLEIECAHEKKIPVYYSIQELPKPK